ncbi:AraC family transcriptional regulator [Shewanella sp. UCD-KL12]|uniref:AraC family transcriptional regulator n=1 Tax=Shewanella sp. UCD-KL12 TaxID=1917163 RepID=UPI000970D55E|nr:AraC family transcriptional regulator [Shewanella sp. UCD-KL12]
MCIVKEQRKPILGSTSLPPVQQFLHAARQYHVDISAGLKQTGIEFDTFLQLDARLTGEQFQQLLVYLITQAKHPLFGLYSAKFIQPDRFHILGQIGLHSSHLAHAINEAMPLEKLVGDMGVTELKQHQLGVKMVWRCQYSNPLVIPHLIDNVLASWVNFARYLLDDKVASPLEVKLQKSQPTPLEVVQYEEVFGCPVKFGQREDSILISHIMLNRSLPDKNPKRLQQLKASATLSLDHIDSSDRLELETARIIRQLLPQGKIDRQKVAKHLHMSGRTLQRKLLSTGKSYQTLVDDIRIEMADYWLTCSELSTDEIALQLGFSDARVFFRAYKTWTGKTPGSLRR